METSKSARKSFALAAGIGANTAIFSLLDGLVLRDLPVPHPEELVHVAAYAPDNSDSGLSLPMFEGIAREQRVFSSMFMWEGEGIESMQINGSLSSGDVWPIDGNFYADLGAVPFLGRLIGPQDVDLNSEVPTPVAVLGYDFWQLHYGRDRSVIGKTISIEEIPSLEQARAQLDSLWPAILSATIPTNPELRARFLALQLRVVPDSKGGSYVLGRFSTPLYVLLGISGLVLLIACLNLASLMLSRAAA